MKNLYSSIYYYCAIHIRYFFDKIAALTAKKGAIVDSNKSLILVRVDAIGDFILWLDGARQLREHYPHRPIILIANEIWADFARIFPYWDHIIPIDVSAFSSDKSYRRKQIRIIRHLNAFIAIQPTYSRLCDTGDAMIRASAAPTRIGSQGDLSNSTPYLKAIADKWYTRLIPADPCPMMELARNQEFVAGLTQRASSVQIAHIPHTAVIPASACLPEDYFVVFPGAGWPARQWPAQNFASLIERIVSDTGMSAVLCGGPREETLGESIRHLCQVRTYSLIAKTSLLELASIIRMARFLVGNETSAIHMAAAVRTKSVCIVGGGHYGRFIPYQAEESAYAPIAVTCKMPCYNCNWHCPFIAQQADQPVPCIANISIADVHSACAQVYPK